MTGCPLGAVESPDPAHAARRPPAASAAAARKKRLYRPGATKYDDLLPPNYAELMPKAALEAFKQDRDTFDWKDIPEWVPPKELR